MTSSQSQTDPTRVAAGLKAAIHNPNVSQGAKASATERLHEMGADIETKRSSGNREAENPNRKNETKPGDVLDDDGEFDNSADFKDDAKGGQSGQAGNRVLGGYKAALKNPNVSAEAKQHAEKMLKDNLGDA